MFSIQSMLLYFILLFLFPEFSWWWEWAKKVQKDLGDFVLILINSGFGTKPMVSSALLYKEL